MAKFKSSAEEGSHGERRFKNIIESFGLLLREASFKENVHDHIDFFVKGKTETLVGFKFSVDVKARKRKSRDSDEYDDEYTWIEFKNVQGKTRLVVWKSRQNRL